MSLRGLLRGRITAAILLGYGALWPGLGGEVIAETPSEEAGQHIVEPGDTLWSLAEHYLGSVLEWPRLQEWNRVESPYHLRPGTSLVVEEGSATVMHLDGRAWVTTPEGEQPLHPGMRVRVGQLLETATHTFLSLQLPDDSRIVLPSSSRLILAELGGGERVRIELLDGEVESRVPSREGSDGRFEVMVPGVTIGVRGTHFRVGSGKQGLVTGVLEGRVEVLMDGQGAIDLAAGQGGRLGQDGHFEQVVLLPPPLLVSSWRGTEDFLETRVEPMEGAHAYRLQLAQDPQFVSIVREGVSESGEFRLPGVGEGAYHVRVTAIDALGIEGQPRHSVLFYRLGEP